jgi:hypothetical protein
LCQLAEAGLLRASFVPPKPIRDLRQLTRYLRAQIAERKREAQRLHKALEDTGIKLDCVATDILGKSGRAMLEALVAGTTDPELLAELARGQAAEEDPGAEGGARGAVRAAARAAGQLDPRPPRLPRRADRPAIRGPTVQLNPTVIFPLGDPPPLLATVRRPWLSTERSGS